MFYVESGLLRDLIQFVLTLFLILENKESTEKIIF